MKSTRSMSATTAALLLALTLGSARAATPTTMTYAFNTSGNYPLLQVNQTGSQIKGFILFRTHESQTSVGQQFFTGTRVGQSYSLTFKLSQTGVITGCRGVLSGTTLALQCMNQYGGTDIRLALKKTTPRAGYDLITRLHAPEDCRVSHDVNLEKAFGMIDSLIGLPVGGRLTYEPNTDAVRYLLSATAVTLRLQQEGDDYRNSRSFAIDVEWLKQVRDQEREHSSEKALEDTFARVAAADARISAQFQKLNPQFIALLSSARQAAVRCPPDPLGIIDFPKPGDLQRKLDDYRTSYYAPVQKRHTALAAALKKARSDMEAVLTPANLRFSAQQRALTPLDPRDAPGYVAPRPDGDSDNRAPNAYNDMISAQNSVPDLAPFATDDFYQDDFTPGKIAMSKNTEDLAYELDQGYGDLYYATVKELQ